MFVGDIGGAGMAALQGGSGCCEGADAQPGLGGGDTGLEELLETSLIDLLMELLGGEDGEAGGPGDGGLDGLVEQLGQLLGGDDEEGVASDPCACAAEDGAKAGGEAGGLDDLLGGGFEDLLSDAVSDVMETSLGELLGGALADALGGGEAGGNAVTANDGQASASDGQVAAQILGNDNNVNVDFTV